MNSDENRSFDEDSTASSEYLPGFGNPMDPQMQQKYANRMESRINLIVFVLVLLGLTPFLIWGQYIFHTASKEHFLVGLPLPGFNSLQPVVGTEPPPKTSEFMNKTLFIVLWGPWDDYSLSVLRQLNPLFVEARKNPDFQVIPIAYFASTSEPVKWYEMDSEERERFLQQKKLEESRLGLFVQNSFRHGFTFPTVWWDPVDRFRLDLLDMALADSTNPMKVDGIGFPTIIYAQNGVIRNVWSTDSEEDWNEMSDLLKALAAGAK